jgi:hypothetical protein
MRILNFCRDRGCRKPRRNCRVVRETQRESTHIKTLRLAPKNPRKVKLLHLLLETTRQSRVHRRPTREDDVLVEVGANVDRSCLDGVEEHFCEKKEKISE